MNLNKEYICSFYYSFDVVSLKFQTKMLTEINKNYWQIGYGDMGKGEKIKDNS